MPGALIDRIDLVAQEFGADANCGEASIAWYRLTWAQAVGDPRRPARSQGELKSGAMLKNQFSFDLILPDSSAADVVR
jgi:hypothetical protein